MDVEQAITNRAPSFRISLDNRFDKYSALLWNDPITLSIDGQGILKGRIDEPDRSISKKEGRVIELTGRGDAGAFEDILASLHVVNMTPKAIVEKIMAEYNNRKLSGDPGISIQSNRAPDNITMSFLWRRKNLWSMLRDVADQLGAPPDLGGIDQFFDFYVDPTDGLYFEEIGYRDSLVSIPANAETMKRTHRIDSLTVKNDIWLWGNSSAGTIPLEMQTGYVGAGLRQDPWTENNPSDYLAGSNVNSITADASTKILGSYSIKIYGVLVFPDPTKPVKLYWYMPFPFGAPYPPGGSKWPGQDPAGGFNAYNEVSMTETMGEINAVGFFLRTDTPFDFLIEVKDGTSATVAQSQSAKVDPGGPFSNWFNPNWVYVQLPFGPSANYKNMSDKDTIDWSNIAEVRFCCFISPGVGTVNIWFDGFRFIKPLVVNKSRGTTRRTFIHNASAFDSYTKAAIYCEALLENLENPQRYYDFENLGRVDIPIGYKFSLEGVQLVMRELSYHLSKDQGWIIKGRGFEQT
jgi:hypothetical protein